MKSEPNTIDIALRENTILFCIFLLNMKRPLNIEHIVLSCFFITQNDILKSMFGVIMR